MSTGTDALSTELALDADVAPTAPYVRVAAPAEILLTGGTGFLGAFVLHDLLRFTRAKIHCLVRADGPESARQRLLANLSHYALSHPELAGRVVAIPGSVELPRLGLDDATYERLAESVDTVFHLAADTSFMPRYEQLKATNVTGLVHVLRFACDKRTKNVQYSSTYAVFNSAAYTLAERVYETKLVGTGSGFGRGYDLSKWVAEHLVERARERGLPVTIHRVGYISGDTRHGIHNKMDPVAQMLAVALCNGYVVGIEALLHLTPVDWCSRALVKLSLLPESVNATFHLVQPRPLSASGVVDWMEEEGYDVKRVEFEEWYEQLRSLCRRYPQFIPAFYLSSRGEARAFGEGDNLASLHFDSSHVDALLAPEDHCAAIESPLLRLYFEYIASPERGYDVTLRPRSRSAA